MPVVLTPNVILMSRNVPIMTNRYINITVRDNDFNSE